MGIFLLQLCVLKSVDQCKFFLFHALNIKLVLGLLHLFPRKLLLKSHPCTVLTFHEVHLALLCCRLLLRLDHVLHVAGAILFSLPLLHVSLPSLLLLSLCLIRSLLLLDSRCHLAVIDGFIGLRFLLLIVLASHLLVHLLLAQALIFGLLVHHVALALRNDLVGTLARFINLLVHLQSHNQNGG